MERKITVNGMHCEACKALIRMTLEDGGLGPNIKDIDLTGDNQGYVLLSNVDEEDLTGAKNLINELDQYTAIIE